MLSYRKENLIGRRISRFRLKPCFSRFIVFYLLLPLWISPSLAYSADSYQRVDLKHRNAAVLQQTLAPLLGEAVAISAEGSALLIRAPQAEIKSILSLVRSMDRPQRSLKVFIYRGIDPSALEASSGAPFTDQRWSTQVSRNRVDRLTMLEGSTLVITQDRWLGLPIVHRQTAAAGENVLALLFKDLSFPNTAFQSREEYTQWLSTEESLYLTPVVIDGKPQPRVSLQLAYSLPATGASSSSETISVPLKASLVTVIEPDQWQLISSHSLQSHPEPISTQSTRKLRVSTQKNNELEQRVWVNISLENP